MLAPRDFIYSEIIKVFETLDLFVSEEVKNDIEQMIDTVVDDPRNSEQEFSE